MPGIPTGDFGRGSFMCPAGSYVIVDEAQCKIAVLNHSWNGRASSWERVLDHSGYPRGCSVEFDRGQLNTHPTGTTRPSEEVLCASDTGLRS